MKVKLKYYERFLAKWIRRMQRERLKVTSTKNEPKTLFPHEIMV